MRRILLRAFTLAAPLAFLGASCGPDVVGMMPGVINDPHNLSLRRDLLSRAKPRVCDEVGSRSLPIRARDEGPAIGRFVPLQCNAVEQPGGELHLQIAGRGYVWTSLSQRLGFEASTAVAYDTDFQIGGGSTWLYLRPKAPPQAQFATRLVEQMGASLFAGGATGGSSLTDRYGGQIMTNQLARGLTVVRAPDGMLELAVGVLPPGMHPQGGVAETTKGGRVFVNDRAELHANQRDFVPFNVPEGARAAILVGVAGAPAVDALVVPRAVGDAWLAAYVAQAAPTPPPAQPVLDEVVAAGPLLRRELAAPPGAYYLVLDNTSAAGRTPSAAADRALVVSYAIELL
jgi:hypothetical protein